MAKKEIDKDFSTEEKIKEAASKMFQKKGFAGTRTRDIAEEAGINLALLNYYFRSKQNLFEIIMKEKIGSFIGSILPILADEQTTLQEKVKNIAGRYIDMLNESPELPLFVLNEIKMSPESFVKMISGGEFIRNSAFTKQLKQRNPKVNSDHFFMNILGLCIFPFIMKPALQIITKKEKNSFFALMEERKKLIPVWIEAMINAT